LTRSIFDANDVFRGRSDVKNRFRSRLYRISFARRSILNGRRLGPSGLFVAFVFRPAAGVSRLTHGRKKQTTVVLRGKIFVYRTIPARDGCYTSVLLLPCPALGNTDFDDNNSEKGEKSNGPSGRGGTHLVRKVGGERERRKNSAAEEDAHAFFGPPWASSVTRATQAIGRGESHANIGSFNENSERRRVDEIVLGTFTGNDE